MIAMKEAKPTVERVLYNKLKEEFDNLQLADGESKCFWLVRQAQPYGDLYYGTVSTYFSGKTQGLETNLSLYMLAFGLEVYDLERDCFIDHKNVDLSEVIDKIPDNFRNANFVKSLDNRILWKSIYGAFLTRKGHDGGSLKIGELLRKCEVLAGKKISTFKFYGSIRGVSNQREEILNILLLALNLELRKRVAS